MPIRRASAEGNGDGHRGKYYREKLVVQKISVHAPGEKGQRKKEGREEGAGGKEDSKEEKEIDHYQEKREPEQCGRLTLHNTTIWRQN
jgi:hypothetical protein